MKVCSVCGGEIGTRDGDNMCSRCEAAADRGKCRKGAREARRIRHQIMTEFGLVRVRGALGGVYYE